MLLQALLLALNNTISDVNDDNLQLVAIEELLPLSGPSAVTVITRSVAAPATGRRLLNNPTGNTASLLRLLKSDHHKATLLFFLRPGMQG